MNSIQQFSKSIPFLSSLYDIHQVPKLQINLFKDYSVYNLLLLRTLTCHEKRVSGFIGHEWFIN
jgi:hypothetical protein